ncbi:MAG: hypothetical protein KF775_12000 [Cyclobacteriaceae bacterium]|nr:hypothetical protein [Cyclobacteriaceae bacterium]
MAASIYRQSIDKQRIILVGAHRALIAQLAQHVLSENQRKFDLYKDGQPVITASEAPVAIIEATDQWAEYQHHILVISEVPGANEVEKIADATPKGGIIIYPENNKALKAIGSRERPDVQAIGYTAYKHEVKNGQTILITSTNEKFAVALTSETELLCLGAARELLKKIGISSGQFYRAASTFKR